MKKLIILCIKMILVLFSMIVIMEFLKILQCTKHYNQALGLAEFLIGTAIATGISAGASAIQGYLQRRHSKRLQSKIFSREDTAVQRRRYDLEQAGLSPTLAAGQGAPSGQVLPTPSYEHGLGDLGSKVVQALSAQKQMEQSDANILLTKMQEKQASRNIKSMEIKDQLEEEKIYTEIAKQHNIGMDTRDKQYELEYRRRHKLFKGSTTWEKYIGRLFGLSDGKKFKKIGPKVDRVGGKIRKYLNKHGKGLVPGSATTLFLMNKLRSKKKLNKSGTLRPSRAR